MLTPDEIQLKTFAVTLRGFDQVEVTRFLRELATQLQETLDLVETLQGGSVLEDANRAAAEIMAEAEAEAEAIKSLTEDMRAEASRIRSDAIAHSERELKQTVRDCEEIKLKTVEEIESILGRADEQVSAMLHAFRENRDDILGIGRHLVPRSQRKGSQRQLGK
jgi:DivIVA domain-containing protein